MGGRKERLRDRNHWDWVLVGFVGRFDGFRLNLLLKLVARNRSDLTHIEKEGRGQSRREKYEEIIYCNR